MTATMTRAPGGPRLRFSTRPPARWKVVTAQLAAIAVFLLLWQYLPTISWFSTQFRFLNRFYISSPTAVAQTIWYLMTGTHNEVSLWPSLGNTLTATVLGTVIGLLLGAAFGLVCSTSMALSQFAKPFVVIANSVPRVALIPIVVLIVGPTVASSTVSAVLIVFFLGFFNSFAGGTSVAADVINNARLLGASRWAVMIYVRGPQVMVWTFAAVPNAISFGLVAVVTTELLTGVNGMGSLVLAATNNLEADLSLAVVVLLSLVGLILYGGAELLRRRLLHWRDDGQAAT